jgi:hypothetical protein
MPRLGRVPTSGVAGYPRRLPMRRRLGAIVQGAKKDKDALHARKKLIPSA